MTTNRVPEGQYTETIYGMVRRRRGWSFLGVTVVVLRGVVVCSFSDQRRQVF